VDTKRKLLLQGNCCGLDPHLMHPDYQMYFRVYYLTMSSLAKTLEESTCL